MGKAIPMDSLLILKGKCYMDRRHFILKYGWEATSTLSLAVIGAGLIGYLLTQQVSGKLGVTVVCISIGTLAISILERANLAIKEKGNE